jgi:hypothetical protein
MMLMESGLRVGDLPIGKLSARWLALGQVARQLLQPQGEQAAFGGIRSGLAASRGSARQQLTADISPHQQHQPGGQSHGDQQPFDMRQHHHLTTPPLPAGRLMIAESAFNRKRQPYNRIMLRSAGRSLTKHNGP